MELRRVPATERGDLLPLLELADDVAAGYIDDGDLWAYGEGGGATDALPDGVILTVPADEAEHGPATVELRNVAVHPDRRRRGVGMAMVAAVVDALRGEGWRRAVVGTGTADPVTYVLYQRCGFRPHHVERDVFTPERGYDPGALREPNGLVHRDMLWFDLDL